MMYEVLDEIIEWFVEWVVPWLIVIGIFTLLGLCSYTLWTSQKESRWPETTTLQKFHGQESK